MSFMGTVMVCGILLVRAAGYRKVSKQIFLILWMIAALRFLTPWQLPWSPEFGGQKVEKMSATWIQEREGTEQVKERQEERASEEKKTAAVSRETYEPEQALSEPPIMGFPWNLAVRGIWFAGAAAVGICFTVQYLIHWRKMREILPAEDWPAVKYWQERQEARDHIRVFYTDYYDTPFSMGILRKKIVLTRECRRLSCEQLQGILEHEAVHLRRLDCLWKLAGILVVIPHWFNPLAWLMLKKLEEDLEISCDERVIRRYGIQARKQYAKTLLAMDRGGRTPFPANGFGGKKMRKRIRCILDKKSSRFWSGMVLATCGIFLAGCMGGESISGEKTAENGTDRQLIAGGQDQLLQQLSLGTEIIYPETMTIYRGDPYGELVVAEKDSEEKWLMGITMLPVDSSGNGSQGQINPGVYGAICGEGYQVFDTYLFPVDKGEGAVVSLEMKEPLPFAVGYVKDGIYTEAYQVQEQDITVTSSGRYVASLSFPETGSYCVVIHNTSEEVIRLEKLHIQYIDSGSQLF